MYIYINIYIIYIYIYIIYIYIYIYTFVYIYILCIGYITARVLYQIYKNRARGRGFYKCGIARVAVI